MPLSVTKRSAIEIDVNIDITYRFSKPVANDSIKLLIQKLLKWNSLDSCRASWYNEYAVVPSLFELPNVVGSRYEVQPFDVGESTTGGLHISSPKDNIFSKTLLLYDDTLSSNLVSPASIRDRIIQHIKTNVLRSLLDLYEGNESHHLELVTDNTEVLFVNSFKILGISKGSSSTFVGLDDYYMVSDTDADVMERGLHEAYYDWYRKDAAEGFDYNDWIGMNVGQFLESDVHYQHLPVIMINSLGDF